MESNLPINLKVSGSMYNLICNQITTSMKKEVACGKHKKKLTESKSKLYNIPHLISNQLNLRHFPRRSTHSFGKTKQKVWQESNENLKKYSEQENRHSERNMMNLTRVHTNISMKLNYGFIIHNYPHIGSIHNTVMLA